MIVKLSKNRAAAIMQILCQTYHYAQCELIYNSSFQLLIAVILSAQCTDKQVNLTTPKLFKFYPDAESLAKAPIDHVKELIKSIGFFNVKAQNIINCAQVLREKYQGIVPNKLEDLISLPGVGRKTANVVLGVAFKQRAWTVDTHLNRLARRLGFSQNNDPYKIELDLIKLFKTQDWTFYSIVLIFHGRRMCKAQNPSCSACPVNKFCPSFDQQKRQFKAIKS